MKKSVWKRVLALVLCLALSAGYLPVPSFAEETEEPVAFQQEEPVEEPEEEAQETQAPTTEPTAEPTEESTAATEETAEPAEESTEAPQEEPDLDQAVATLQALIDALPEEVTEDNAEIVAAQLETVFDGLETLTEAQLAQLDLTRYRSALAALDALTGGLQEAETLEEEETKVASITRNGETTGYATLEEAMEAAQDNDTVTLLQDVTVSETLWINKSITLDTNGKHMIDGCGSNVSCIIIEKAVTLTGEGIIDRLTVSGAGSFTNASSCRIGKLWYNSEDVRLSGGGYTEIHKGNLAQGNIPGLLAEGYAYQIDGKKVPLSELLDKKEVKATTDYGISVVQCTHGGGLESETCQYCGMSMTASVTKTDGGTTFYATLEEAVNAAGSGATVTMLADLTDDYVNVQSQTFTLDLNGKTLNGLGCMMRSSITVVDSSAGTGGKIVGVAMAISSSLTIESGAIDRINAGGDAITVDGGTVGQIVGSTSVTVSSGKVTSIEMGYAQGTLAVTGGTVENVTLIADQITLTNNGNGEVKNVTIPVSTDTRTRTLSGGPFDQVQITSDSALDSIDLTQFAPDGCMFLFTDGKLVKAGNIEHTQADGKYLYTVTGPVKVEPHTHDYGDSHKCSCGEYDVEASIGNTFYDTLEEAIAAVQTDQIIYLLQDVPRTVTVSNRPSFSLHLNRKKLELLKCEGGMNVWVEDWDNNDGGTSLQATAKDILYIAAGRITKVEAPRLYVNGGLIEEGYLTSGEWHLWGGTVKYIHADGTSQNPSEIDIKDSYASIEKMELASSNLEVYEGAAKEVILGENASLKYWGGTVSSVTLASDSASLSGGPFDQVRIESGSALTLGQLQTRCLAENEYFFKGEDKIITAQDYTLTRESGKYIYTIQGPVSVVKHTHSFDQDTGICPCGEQAEAKVNDTVYKTFEEALEALNSASQSGPSLELLKNVDLSGKTLSITKYGTRIYWNGHTLTVGTLNISAHAAYMEDTTGAGGVNASNSIQVMNTGLTVQDGTYYNLVMKYNGVLQDGTYYNLKIDTSDMVAMYGGTYHSPQITNGQVVIEQGKVFYTTDGQVFATLQDAGSSTPLTLKDHDPHTPDGTTGECICGLSFAASVTAGETTAYYATLEEAITEAAKTSGSTVKLFGNGANVSVSSGTFTLNWNGYTVTQLTVTGGDLTLTGEGGVNGTVENALDIQGGTVNIQSGSYNNVYVGESASITFAGGEIKGTDGKLPVTIGDASRFQVPAGKVLYSSYYRKIRPYTYFTEGETLTVKDCSDHDALYDNPDVCMYCATEFVAKVTDETYRTEYYTDFKTALRTVQGKAGSTLTLLRDVEIDDGQSIINKGTFTIDWNGHTVGNLNLTITINDESSVTLKSSKEGGGITDRLYILAYSGSVTVESGSYCGVDVYYGTGLTIKGGTYGNGSNTPISLSRGQSFTVPTGYVFYDKSEKVIADWKTSGFEYGSTVTLKYHENHDPDENGKCVCGLSGAAVLKVTDYQGNFTETPYNDFSALQAAETANNTDVRLTLWVDISLDTAETISSDSYAFTLDWNGKKVLGSGSFTINSTEASITLTDSQGDGGLEVPLTINGKVTLEGGRYKAPITLGDNAELTLPLEKAFHNESGKVIPQEAALAMKEGYVYVATHDHKTSGCDCGRGVAAIVTLNGQDTPYSTLAEAFEDVVSGCTLKLLSNGTLKSNPGTWDFTLDLGGCTLTTYTDEYNYDPAPDYGQALTIQDSGGNGVLKTQKGISLDSSGSVALEGGTVEGNIDGGSGYSTITVSGGTVTGSVIPNMGFLTITGGRIGTLEQGYAMTTRTLHGGTFGKLNGCDRYMLEEGWALYDAEGNVVNIGGTDIQNVTIKAHTHDFKTESGTCPCGGVTSGEGLDIPASELEALGYGYQVNGEQVNLQSRTWNNQTYLSREDGKPLKDAIIQTYTDSDQTNSNGESYPVGMTVYRVVENEDHVLELRQETALTNLLIYRGASVRCTEPSGIRIITGMTKENKEALKGSGLDGFTLVQAGTVAAWVDEMGGETYVTLEKSFRRYGAAFVKGVRDNVFKELDNEIQYTNVLINFPDSKLGNSLVLRSYAILEKDGIQYTVYGGQVTRSIKGIAIQILGELQDGNITLTATEQTYLAGLIADAN